MLHDAGPEVGAVSTCPGSCAEGRRGAERGAVSIARPKHGRLDARTSCPGGLARTCDAGWRSQWPGLSAPARIMPGEAPAIERSDGHGGAGV